MSLQPQLFSLPYKHTEMVSLSPGYKEDANSVLWMDPKAKIIARGERKTATGYEPTWSEAIVNYGLFNEQKELVESGKQSDVKGLGGFTQEWYGRGMEVLDRWNNGGKKAVEALGESGMLTGADFAAVKSAVVALKTTATPLRNHVLLQLVTRMQSDRLDLKVLDYTDYAAINEELGVWTIPISGKGGFTSQEFSQKKYGYHLQFSEDFTMQAYDVDVSAYHINGLQGQMDTVMNKKVAAEINALSGTGQGSWSAFSGGLSSRNAKIDVKNIATVVDNSMRGSPQVIVSKRDVYDAYQTNTTVAPGGYGAFAGVSYQFGNGIITGIGGFDSIRWGVDDLITTDQYTVYDPNGILFVDGPQRTAQYQDTRTGISGTIFKRWFRAKIIDALVFNKGTTIL